MSIIGTFPATIANGQVEDATVVMSLFSWIQAQTNGNACPATVGTLMLKGDGFGGTTGAAAGTDYVSPTTLSVPTGSSLIGFIQSGTGAVALTVQDKARESVSVLDFCANGVSGVAVDPTGVVDSYLGIQAAINKAAINGGKVYFPSGNYLHSTTLIFKNNVTYIGDGKSNTTLTYTGNSDQIQVNNPINSSTRGDIHVEGILFNQTSSQVAGKANFADVGSTFLTFSRCRFKGAMIQIILDQSELVRIRDCEILLGASVNSIGIWLVNGAEHTALAAPMFTNQILVEGCQFNGTTGGCIIDDGGYDHEFRGNNFNGCVLHGRVTGVNNLVIDGGEYENPTSACFSFVTTKNSGAAPVAATQTVAINGGFYVTGALPAISFVGAGGYPYLKLTNNVFSSSGAVIVGGGYLSDVISFGNSQISSGSGYAFINNYFDGQTYIPSWVGSVTNPVLGNGVFAATYSRKGKQVTVNLRLVPGSTTTFGSGYYSFSIPYTSANNSVYYESIAMCEQASTTIQIARVLPNGTAIDFSGPNGVAATLPAAWASGHRLTISLTYETLAAIN